MIRRAKNCEAVALGLILTLALWIRVPGLFAGLQIDEDATVALHEEGDLTPILTSWRDHPSANVTAYLAATAVQAIMDSDYPLWAARLPSLAASVLALVFFYLLVRRQTSAIPTVLVMAYLCLTIQHIEFSTSIRGYSFQVCGVVAMTYFFMCVLQTGSGRFWLAYAATLTLSGWSHLWALLAMLGHAVYLCVLLIPGVRMRLDYPAPNQFARGGATMLGAVVMLGLLYLPAWPEIATVLQSERTSQARSFWHSIRFAFEQNMALDGYSYSPWQWGIALTIVCGLLRGVWQTRLGSLSICMLATIVLVLMLRPPAAFGSRYLLFLPWIYLVLFAASLQTFPRVRQWSAEPVSAREPESSRVGNLLILAVLAATTLALIGAVVVSTSIRLQELGIPFLWWFECGLLTLVLLLLQFEFSPVVRRLLWPLGAIAGVYLAATCLDALASSTWHQRGEQGLLAAAVAVAVGGKPWSNYNPVGFGQQRSSRAR